jgi:hypothetical protein
MAHDGGGGGGSRSSVVASAKDGDKKSSSVRECGEAMAMLDAHMGRTAEEIVKQRAAPTFSVAERKLAASGNRNSVVVDDGGDSDSDDAANRRPETRATFGGPGREPMGIGYRASHGVRLRSRDAPPTSTSPPPPHPSVSARHLPSSSSFSFAASASPPPPPPPAASTATNSGTRTKPRPPASTPPSPSPSPPSAPSVGRDTAFLFGPYRMVADGGGVVRAATAVGPSIGPSAGAQTRGGRATPAAVVVSALTDREQSLHDDRLRLLDMGYSMTRVLRALGRFEDAKNRVAYCVDFLESENRRL